MPQLIVFLLSLLVTAQGWAIGFHPNPAIAEIFNASKIEGTFVLYDADENKLTGFNKARAETRYIPASTFKIPHTLIGLATGAVSNVDEVLYQHDGKPKMLMSWEQDMGLRQAMSTSNVHAYQVLSRRITVGPMQENIKTLNFGNNFIGQSVETFWLDGSLKISAVEQAMFLARLAHGQLPYPAGVQADVREIIKLETGNGWTLYGKTGWAGRDQPGIGWLVGWVEQGKKIHSFALNIDVPQDTVPPALPSALAKRIDIAKASLRASGLLDEGRPEIERVQLPDSTFPVLQAVIVPPNASTVYLSGMLPEVSNQTAPKNSLEAYGDTQAQTISVLRRIEAALARQGLTMGDVIQLKVFLVGDPRKQGSLDFAGFQAGYSQFFATIDQPGKPVRSVLQIAGLALPGALVEIEATAAKVR